MSSANMARPGDKIEIVLVILTGYACHLYYNLIGHLASLRGADYGPWLLTPVDRAAPYMPFWVNFYQLAYFTPAVVLLLLLMKVGWNTHEIRRWVASFLLLLGVHYILYLAIPTSAQAIRLVDEALGDGLLGGLVRYQYKLATAWCAWPSLHVSACWFFYRLLRQHFRGLHWLYLAWFVGMFIGTFSIKIHYVLDGVTGLLLGEAAYRFVYLTLARRESLEWRWKSEAVRASVHIAILALVLLGIPIVMRASGFAGSLYTLGVSS